MKTFSQWLHEDQGATQPANDQDGPEARWQKLIDLHRVQFTSRFKKKIYSLQIVLLLSHFSKRTNTASN